MPKRIAVKTVHINREGKTIIVKPGQQFDFTAAELEDIKKVNEKAVRVLANEEANAPVADTKLDATKTADQKNAADTKVDDKKAKEDAKAGTATKTTTSASAADL